MTDPASPPRRARNRRGVAGILVGLGIIGIAIIVSVVFGISRPGPPTDELTLPTSTVTMLTSRPSTPPGPSSPALSTRPPTSVSVPATASAGPGTTSAGPTTALPTSATPTPTPMMSAAQADAAVAVLVTLPVKGRAPKTGYTRAQFGDAWTDDVDVAGGHNGCDTRNDILGRDLVQITVKPGTRGCVVLTGVLHDPYSATVVAFSRTVDAAAVQIDHVVALSNAWQTGAQQLSAQRRQDLANDPANLQATTRAMNAQKGDGDAATWLPANKSYRCTYVSRQITVKAVYGLWVTPAERAAMVRVLTGCGATAPNSVTTTATSTTAIQPGDDGRPTGRAQRPDGPDHPGRRRLLREVRRRLGGRRRAAVPGPTRISPRTGRRQ